MRNIDECFDIIRKWVWSQESLEQDFLEALNDVMVMAQNNNETKTGEWISEMVYGVDWKGCKREYYQPISCSKCHKPNHCKSTYCPNCGALMVNSQESAK